MYETKKEATQRRVIALRRSLNEVAQDSRYRTMNGFEQPEDALAGILDGIPGEHHGAIQDAMKIASNPNARPTDREDAVNGAASLVGDALSDSAPTETYDPAELAAQVHDRTGN